MCCTFVNVIPTNPHVNSNSIHPLHLKKHWHRQVCQLQERRGLLEMWLLPPHSIRPDTPIDTPDEPAGSPGYWKPRAMHNDSHFFSLLLFFPEILISSNCMRFKYNSFINLQQIMKPDMFTVTSPWDLSTLPRRRVLYKSYQLQWQHLYQLQGHKVQPLPGSLVKFCQLFEGLQPQETCDIISLLIKSKEFFSIPHCQENLKKPYLNALKLRYKYNRHYMCQVPSHHTRFWRGDAWFASAILQYVISHAKLH